MRIDFDKKIVAGLRRTNPIVSLDKSERQILLQGTELGYGWTIAIGAQDGAMAESLVSGDNVVAVFGMCTPL